MVDNSQTESQFRGQVPLAAGAGGRNVVGVPEEPGRDPGDCIKGPLAGFLRDICVPTHRWDTTRIRPVTAL